MSAQIDVPPSGHYLKRKVNLTPSLAHSAGEGIVDSALAEPSGAGDDAWARIPQTGDFITNVSACRGGGRIELVPSSWPSPACGGRKLQLEVVP